MGLRDLSDELFNHYLHSNQMHHLQQAFSSLPAPQMVEVKDGEHYLQCLKTAP